MKFKDYDPKLFKVKRVVLDLSQEDLAIVCKTTRQTVSAIENGHKLSDLPIITLIGLALDGFAEEKGERTVRLFSAMEDYGDV